MSNFQSNPTPSVVLIANGRRIPLTEQNVDWSLQSGVLPYTTAIILPSGDFSTDANAAVNPVSLEFEFSTAIGRTGFSKKKILFENLFLHERREHSFYEHIYKLSDVRYFLKGKKAFVGKNITRVITEVGLLNPPTTKAGVFSPAILRQPFDIFKLGRYVKDSVKTDQNPFRVSEICQSLLVGLNLPVNVTIDPFILNQDGDYIIENIIIEGEDIYSSLSRILRMGRLNLGILPNGDLYIFSVDFFDKAGVNAVFDITKNNNLTSSPGRIYLQDLKRIRPPKITVLFERLNETRVIVEEPTLDQIINVEQVIRPLEPVGVSVTTATSETQISSQRAIACVNMIKVPFVPANSPFFTVFGLINVGQYFPIQKYFEILGIDEARVRKFWWSSALEIMIQRVVFGQGNFEVDILARIIGQAIRRDYRQLFQIDRFYLDRIKFWENKRVAVVDNFSAMRPPSPLWVDMTIFPRNRDIAVVRGQVTHDRNVFVYRVNQADPLRENPTAGTIKIINQELGVFAVDLPPLSDSLIAEIVPSAIDGEISVTPTKETGGQGLLANHPLAEDFTLETMISICWNFDHIGSFDSRVSSDIDGKYYDLEYTYPNAEGPPIEFLSSMDYARCDIDANFINQTVLGAISEAEAAKIFNQFIDRFVGLVKVPGIVDNFKIEGNLTSITFSSSPSGIETIFDLTQIPFDPEVIQLLPNAVRAYLYRQVGKGGP